ncbi:MAG: response regulator transcription factor [Granulosicoccus sp.]|nr:response regulator transcription factor [Granulosicoccus sp.]
MRKNILLIEDEQDIADLLCLHLQDCDAEVTHASDGVRGLTLALQQQWDMILLDLCLPRCDGLDICEQVRQSNPGTPVIMITARSSESDRVRGLNMGADDYITKPFSISELIARVKALFRRAEAYQQNQNNTAPPATEIIAVNNLLVNRAERTVSVAGRNISLTVREFDLLLFFAQSPGTVFKRTELLEKVWGYSFKGYLHTVNSHINRLRAKIEPDPSNPQYIETVWGVGYKLINHPDNLISQ